MRFDGARPIGNGTLEIPEITIHELGKAGIISQGGTRETRHVGFFGQPKNFDDILQGTRHWLVDEKRFSRSNHRLGLFQMRPAIHTLEKHCVYFFAKSLDRIDDFHLEFISQLLRESVHS